MYIYTVYVCVCDQGSEAKRGRDGLLAVSVIGLLDLLISGPEAWILHSTAHLGEDFNPGKCWSVCVCVCYLVVSLPQSALSSSSSSLFYLVLLSLSLC